MPFILGRDDSYDHDLNRFFRACPTMGVRSMNSLKAYGRDILVWMRFLADRRDGKSLWRADRDDIAAFHEARRLSAPPHRVSATSWNLSIAALDKLHRDRPPLGDLDDRGTANTEGRGCGRGGGVRRPPWPDRRRRRAAEASPLPAPQDPESRMVQTHRRPARKLCRWTLDQRSGAALC